MFLLNRHAHAPNENLLLFAVNRTLAMSNVFPWPAEQVVGLTGEDVRNVHAAVPARSCDIHFDQSKTLMLLMPLHRVRQKVT